MPDRTDPQGPTEMERARAARFLLVDAKGPVNDEAAELAAFMDIFHPNHPLTAGLVNELEQKRGGHRRYRRRR